MTNQTTEEIQVQDRATRLKAVKPERPPSKQRQLESLLDLIEEKLEAGASIEQVWQATFPEVTQKMFKLMLHRARKKRDNKTGTDGGAAASPQPAETPVSPSAGSRASRGGSVKKPSPGKGSAVAASPAEGRPAASPAADEGGASAEPGELTEEQRELITDDQGRLLENQDDRLPPPWSDLPVTYDDIPDDLPEQSVLASRKTWLAVHFYLRAFKRIESGEMHRPWFGNEVCTTTLDNLQKNNFPRSEGWATQVTMRNKKRRHNRTNSRDKDRQMEM